MALLRLWAPNPARPKLDRQPVDQPRHFAFRRHFLDQAGLGDAQRFGPARLQRKAVEPIFRIERRRLVGEQPVEMLRLAAGDRCRYVGGGGAAVDTEAGQRQLPGAEPPLLELGDEAGDQPLQRLRGRPDMRRRLLQPQGDPRWALIGDGDQRLRRAARDPVERIDHRPVLEAPGQRQPRHGQQRPDRLQAEPLEGEDGVGVEPECGDGER